MTLTDSILKLVRERANIPNCDVTFTTYRAIIVVYILYYITNIIADHGRNSIGAFHAYADTFGSAALVYSGVWN